MSDYDKIKEYIELGHNIFITGPGGVGKSFYINKLKEEYKDEIALTSTTGVSSHNLKAMTIHSFTGIGIFKNSDKVDSIVSKLKKYKMYETVKTRVRKFSIIVIDEVSMLGKAFLEIINDMLQLLRGNDRLFGGLQVIFTGDFLQLPPINDDFCFTSNIWKKLDLKTIYLTKMFRVNDELYSSILERARLGKTTKEDNQELCKRLFAYKKYIKDIEENEEKDILNIQPTFLYSKKINVEDKNMEELYKNPNELLIFKPIYTDKHKSCKVDFDKINDNLHLKIGAQVMLNVNLDIDLGLVNGSRGVITSYNADKGEIKAKMIDNVERTFNRHEYVHEEDDKVMYKSNQYPFILAYALSIHKVQGCTLDCAVIDLGHSIFEENMAYVALSRVRNLNGLYLQNFQSYKIFASKQALEFYEKIEIV
jgi:ATP-dependent DNA helicase PIF1